MLSSEPIVIIALPAYNEASVIQSVIEEIRAASYTRIVIVDDGSRDETWQVAHDAGVTALRHRLNRGKGAATKTAIEAAKLLGADIIVTMDSDGQHNPKDIVRLINPLLENRADVALGTRLMNPVGMPWHKILANWIGNFLTWYIYGLWVTDSQSGFRAYSRRAAELIDTRSDRYDYESEVIRELYLHKLKYVEIPVEVRYTAYSMGKLERQSFINGIKTFGRMLWRIIH
ncbi:glycosyltransferase family 2 protein [Candidatus Dojkabacteria bacterium]|uniref:Glycosyltransferase family 2 protein n=1 Tax=Candidatus Dojkabacteria bacterium TaxID=2099670 RepID=A0A5C7JBK8_9BACT|nr:MAG: glycosyltransferase family 2 protein [Candidatus Dojkabacteria bacterium]